MSAGWRWRGNVPSRTLVGGRGLSERAHAGAGRWTCKAQVCRRSDVGGQAWAGRQVGEGWRG